LVALFPAFAGGIFHPPATNFPAFRLSAVKTITSEKPFEDRRTVTQELASLRRLASQRRLATLRSFKRSSNLRPQPVPLTGK
jgi:hypothetical protein